MMSGHQSQCGCFTDGKKISYPCHDSNTRSSSPQSSHYTNIYLSQQDILENSKSPVPARIRTLDHPAQSSHYTNNINLSHQGILENSKSPVPARIQTPDHPAHSLVTTPTTSTCLTRTYWRTVNLLCLPGFEHQIIQPTF
jgi:hypothetical protein